MRSLYFFGFILGLAAISGLPVRAEEPPPQAPTPQAADTATAAPAEDTALPGVDASSCIRCHGNQAMKQDVDRKDGLVHNLSINYSEFHKSVHGGPGNEMACTDCHDQGFSRYPHQEKNTQSCADCHEEAFTAIITHTRDSVHYQSDKVRFTCSACHSAHYMKKAKISSLSEKNAMCITCHNNQLGKDSLTLRQRHDWHPMAQMHLDNTACIACHTQPQDGVPAMAFKHAILPKEKASRACEDCHAPKGKMLHYLMDIGETPRTDLSDGELQGHFYITGATRIAWLDLALLLLVAAAAAGTLGHGLLRMIAYKVRNK